jgi:hypothetical protein
LLFLFTHLSITYYHVSVSLVFLRYLSWLVVYLLANMFRYRTGMAEIMCARFKDSPDEFVKTTDTIIPIVTSLKTLNLDIKLPEVAVMSFEGLITDGFTQYAHDLFSERKMRDAPKDLVEHMQVFHSTKRCDDDGRLMTKGQTWIWYKRKITQPVLDGLKKRLIDALQLPRDSSFEWSVLLTKHGPSKCQNWHLDAPEETRNRQLSLLINLNQSAIATCAYLVRGTEVKYDSLHGMLFTGLLHAGMTPYSRQDEVKLFASITSGPAKATSATNVYFV